jgi:hypothetical protein
MEDREKVLVIELPQEEWSEPHILGHPVGEHLQLSFGVREAGTMLLRALDSMGRAVLTRALAVAPGENRLVLPLHGLRSGAYLLEVSFGGAIRVLRFVKDRDHRPTISFQ